MGTVDVPVFDRLAWQAMNLWERLDATPPDGTSRASISSHPGVRRLVGMWTKAIAPGRPDLLSRRLRWDGLDEEDLVRAVSAQSTSIPSHLREVMALLGDLAPKEESLRRLEEIPRSYEIPFAELWSSFLHVGLRRLGTTSMIAEQAMRQFGRQLLVELQHACGRPMLELFDSARSQRQDWDPDEDELYTNFSDNLLGRRLRPFSFQYPLAARRAAEITIMWIAAIRELDERLARDAGAIEETFGAPAGRVVSVTHLSDRHLGGRRVLGLELETGLALIYKPRDLALTDWWSRFLGWCAGKTMFAPPTFRILHRNGYGWVEPVGQDGATVELRLWFQRAGALTMLTHLLRGRDLHMENVIAAPSGPVVVDAEALLQPELHRASGPSAMDRGRERVARSALATGLVQLEVADPSGAVHDISGLRGRGGDRSALTATQWRRIGRNGIGYDSVPAEGSAAANLLEVDGRVVELHEMVEPFLEGFAAMYRIVLEHREEMQAWFDDAAGKVCRIVLRPSSQYAATIETMCEARYSSDGLLETMLCEALNRPGIRSQARPAAWDLVRGEQEALHRLDIPLVLTPVDGEADGIVAANGLDLGRAALETMSDEHLAEEIAILQGALEQVPKHSAATVRGEPLHPGGEADRDLLLDAARAIGQRIADEAIAGTDGSAIWMLPSLLYQSGRTARGEAFYLYKGLSGIALFLAALARFDRNTDLMQIAVGALAPLKQLAHEPSLAALMRREPLGGANGIGSILFGLALMDRLDATGQWGELAHEITSHIDPETIRTDLRLDLEGGCAGLVLALRAIGSEDAGRLSDLAARRLIQTAIRRGDGVVWTTGGGTAMTGLAHGNAGIALALARRASTDDEAAETVARALAWENAMISEGAWQLTENAGPPAIDGWCHGAAGIGLSRLEIIKETGMDLSADVERALDLVAGDGLGPIDHLCCGNAGRLEFLTEASRAGWSRAGDLAANLAGRMLDRSKRSGWALDAHTDGHATLTLFRGIAGIGWSLLRCVDATLPSLLTLSTEETGRS